MESKANTVLETFFLNPTQVNDLRVECNFGHLEAVQSRVVGRKAPRHPLTIFLNHYIFVTPELLTLRLLAEEYIASMNLVVAVPATESVIFF